MGAPACREDETLPADLRDALTRSRLAGAVAHLAGVEVLEFSSDWWDGQAHAPCLVVRGGRRHRLLRVVETAGEAVVVPFDKRSAQRWLARRRQPAPVIPSSREQGDVTVDAMSDVQRCASATCGALLPVGYVGGCPVCGGAGASEEKSTATGARTAGSSTSK
jgi:hypothetical protein